MKLTPIFKRLNVVDKRGFNSNSVVWVNWNHVADLRRVKETRDYPEHTEIVLILRPDLQKVLYVRETPEDLTGVWV